MQIHLLSSRSEGSPARTGHPHHLADDLGAALRRHGHRVEIDLLGDTLHGHELGSLREGATAGRKIAPRLSQGGAVVHALDPIAWAAALTARSLADVSVVLRFSEPDRALPATERQASRACLRAADAIAAADDTDRQAAVRAGVPRQRALVVPDVVGLTGPHPDPAMLHPGRTVLSLSGIGPGSGISTLLSALRWVDRDLVVAGSGGPADERALAASLERFGLTDRVRWLGWVDREDVVRLIDAAAVVVLPSPSTGATGAIESMARARAVTTVAGGPAADVVVDGITGLVLPEPHPDLLGRALHGLLNNPFQLEGMGLAGRERALTRYACERAISATEQVYRVALGAA